MPLAKKREKKKTPTWFLAIILVMMSAVFVVQLLFPTNVGKFLNGHLAEATAITVTVTKSDEGLHTYYTDSAEDMRNLQAWAEAYEMRNQSIANSLSADANKIVKYNFAIEAADGTLEGIVFDAKGYVHTGTELYKVIDQDEKFIDELVKQLNSWEKNE